MKDDGYYEKIRSFFILSLLFSLIKCEIFMKGNPPPPFASLSTDAKDLILTDIARKMLFFNIYFFR